MELSLALVLLGLFVVFFASSGAQALSTFSRARLEDLCEQHGRPERLGAILRNYERAAAAAAMLRIIVAQLLVVAVCFRFIAGPDAAPPSGTLHFWSDWFTLAAGCSLIAIAAIIWFPFPLSKISGTWFVYHTWPFWRFLAAFFYPLELVSRFFEAVFRRLAGIGAAEDDEDSFGEEIRTIVTEGHREGRLEGEAREMIESVIELGDVNVSEIMTPRTDMICIPKTLTWEEMLVEVITIPHSRIPVYDSTRDDIIGVLIAKDLLAELAKVNPKDRLHWTELMNEPLFVPETKPVSVLLQEFQHMPGRLPETRNGALGVFQTSSGEQPGEGPTISMTHSHLAIVLDEYGGVSGLVTLEDILEEIVGEIADEHDPVTVQEDIRRLDDQTFDVLGRVHLDELNEQLHLDLPEDEDYDTIAGLIFSTLGHVPTNGETLLYGKEKPLRFTVLEATKRRIDLVRIEKNLPGP